MAIVRRYTARFSFSPTLAEDALEGMWQLARTPGDSQDDLHVTYRRVG